MSGEKREKLLPKVNAQKDKVFAEQVKLNDLQSTLETIRREGITFRKQMRQHPSYGSDYF